MTRENYLRRILSLYRLLPDTPQRFHQADRAIVQRLFEDGTPIRNVEAALLLGSARRACRLSDLPPLNPIRSIAYFLTVLDEIPNTPPPQGYLDYLRSKLGIANHQQGDLTAN